MSIETRVTAVEIASARHDELLKGLDWDVRAFAPIVLDMAGVREALRNLEKSSELCRNEVSKLRSDIDEDRSKQQKNRMLLWIAAISLLGTFVSSTAVVVAAVL